MNNTELKDYLKMPAVPAGAILNRLILQQNRKKVDVCTSANIIPQRLSDLIMGKRRFTPENSLALESALGIRIPGFFYLIQSNNDVYKAQRAIESKVHPNYNVLTQSTFWDVAIEKMNWEKDRFFVIKRVLEYGTIEEIREIDNFYGHKAIMEVYNEPQNFRLYHNVQKKMKELEL